MPKSSKKTKEKSSDFTKAKLKLGKGKQVAQNSVDTSFKARSIVVPNQSIATANAISVPTTHRRLSLDNLLGHLRHHNAGVRKEAISGILELIKDNPSLATTSLPAILQGLSKLIGDEDFGVRRLVHSFFSAVLPTVPTSQLVPHSQTILLFTASAQTHIFPEIRIDATKILNELLDYIPEQVTKDWDASDKQTSSHGPGSKLLRGLLGLLNAIPENTKLAGATPSSLSPEAQLVVMETLTKFLRCALHTGGGDPPQEGIPTWFFSSAFPSSDEYEAFLDLLRTTGPTKSTAEPGVWLSGPDVEGESGCYQLSCGSQFFSRQGWTMSDLSGLPERLDGSSTSGGSSASEADPVTLLLYALQPTLVSTALDSVATLFAPTNNGATNPVGSMKSMLCSMQLARHLYGGVLHAGMLSHIQRDRVRSHLSIYLTHLAPHFPFTNFASFRQDIKADLMFQEMNLINCELWSLWAQDSNSSGASMGLQTQASVVVAYITRLLTEQNEAGPLSAQAYKALLPSLWILLQFSEVGSEGMDDGDEVSAGRLLETIMRHDKSVPSQSLTKQATVEFIARLALLQDQGRGGSRWWTGEHQRKLFSTWMAGLPRTLWEAGSNQESGRLVIMSLIRLIQREAQDAEIVAEISAKLVAYFVVQHPVRGSIPGPFTKLPDGAPVRRLALTLVRELLRCLTDAGIADRLCGAAEQVSGSRLR